jgi:DNA repair protein RadC
LLDNCAAFILSHNHPSGNHSPSLSDKKLTQQFVSVGNALDLPMLDHIIITEGGFYSFATSSGLIK